MNQLLEIIYAKRWIKKLFRIVHEIANARFEINGVFCESIYLFKSRNEFQVFKCDFSETGNFLFNSGEELEQQRLELEIDSEPPESPTGVEIITDPEFWAENDRKIEERMKLRKERLRHFCENVYRNVSDDRKWDLHENLWFLTM